MDSTTLIIITAGSNNKRQPEYDDTGETEIIHHPEYILSSHLNILLFVHSHSVLGERAA